MLDQHHLKQHNRIHTGTAVVLTAQRLYKFVYLVEIYGFIDLSKQMIIGTQALCICDFKYAPIIPRYHSSRLF